MSVVIPREYTARVVKNVQLTSKIFWLQLSPAEPVPYVAGQYASFLIESWRRPLSFATPPAAALEFVVDVMPGGIASQYVSALQVGDTVKFMAPYGRFTMAPTTRPLVFIAGGSGIGPIRAQIMALLSQPATSNITLLFGNRDGRHMFFMEEFQDYAARYPHFTFIPACSEIDPTWTGEMGMIPMVAQRRVADLAGSEVYVCGGPAMVTAAIAMLQSEAVPPAQVHTEKFI